MFSTFFNSKSSKAKKSKIESVFSIEKKKNANILAPKRTFDDIMLFRYCRSREPDRHADRRKVIVENEFSPLFRYF